MLQTLFGRPRRRADDGERGWPTRSGLGYRKTVSGVAVDEEAALTYSAVWCATRALSEPIGWLPLFLYRRTAGDGREVAGDHPLYPILHDAPNPDMGSMAFRESRTHHQINWGGGFAEIERARFNDPTSPVVALWPIHVGRVSPVRESDRVGRDYAYQVRNNDGTAAAFRASEILHVPGCFPVDGLWSRGVIQYARESIGFGLATERHGAAYFGGGAQPKAIVVTPGLREKETRESFRREWKELHGSPESAEVAILPPGSSYNPITISNEDSQFLGTRKHNVAEIGRWYRVPPYVLGEYEKAASYASVEIQSIEFVIYSLMPWVRRWEEQLNLKLLTADERQTYYVEFQLAGLMRGDFQARMAGYQIALMNGIMTLNEVRRLENLNPIGKQGDQHYIPSNMTTAQQLLEMALQPTPQLAAESAATGGAVGEDVQASVMNGGQVSALLAATDKLVLGEYPKEGMRAILEAAFPGVDVGLVATIVTELDKHREKREKEKEAQGPPAPGALPPGAPPPGTPQLPPAPAPEGEEGEESQAALHALRTAARNVLADVLSRLFTKEAKAAERAAKGTDFDQWRADFYDRHEALAAEALGPVAELLRHLDVPVDAAVLAHHLGEQSQAELHAAYDSETPERFAARLADWPTGRAAQVADEVMEVGRVVGSAR